MPGKLTAVAARPQAEDPQPVEELDLEDSPPKESPAELTVVKGETLFGDDVNPEYDAVVARLLEPLDQSLVKKRKGFGRDANGDQNMLRYLEWHAVARQLNRIFGFGAWSTEVVAVEDFYDHNANDGVPRAVRVTKQLSIHRPFYAVQSFIGYSPVQPNRDGKYTWEAYEMAVGNAEATAFKRGAAQFGDQFGLGLYEKGEEATAASAGTTASSSSNSQPSQASNSTATPEDRCEECGREITPWTSNSGKYYSTADLVKFSKRDCDGHVFCGQHKKAYQQEHRGQA